MVAGGKGSRLHRRLVREGRIAQDVAFFLLAFASGPSVFMGWATVRPDATIEAVEAGFLEEIGRLATEDVTDDELLRAKALIETDELGSLQRVGERADRLSMFATLLDEPDEINRQLERYLAVTATDVRESCAAILADDNRVVLTYVPAAGAAAAADEEGDGGAGGGGDDPQVARGRRDGGRGMSAPDPLEAALAARPVPGTPGRSRFPDVERGRLSGGLPVLLVHLPGRPLVSAGLLLPMGAVDEPAAVGGATVLAARSLLEGTRRRDALALVEASERLGASLRAEAGWDSTVIGVDVPSERLARPSSCSQRWSASPPSRRTRSSGSATSGSTTCSRRRPTRRDAPRRRTSPRSTSGKPVRAPRRRPARHGGRHRRGDRRHGLRELARLRPRGARRRRGPGRDSTSRRSSSRCSATSRRHRAAVAPAPPTDAGLPDRPLVRIVHRPGRSSPSCGWAIAACPGGARTSTPSR